MGLQRCEPVHRGLPHEKLQQSGLLHHILRDDQLQSLQHPHGQKYQQYRHGQPQRAASHQIRVRAPAAFPPASASEAGACTAASVSQMPPNTPAHRQWTGAIPSVTAATMVSLVSFTRVPTLSVMRRAVSPKKPACSTISAVLPPVMPLLSSFFSSTGRIHLATVPEKAPAAIPAPAKDTIIAATPPRVCKKPRWRRSQAQQQHATITRPTKSYALASFFYGKYRLAALVPASTADRRCA